MPSCQWFGTRADHELLLHQVFSNPAFEVLDHYSPKDMPLRRYRAVADALALFDEAQPGGPSSSAARLALWVRGSGPGPEITRYRIESGSFAGKWMERCEPKGIILLTLECGRDGLLPWSHTGTVTEATMAAEDGKVTDAKGGVWDIRVTIRAATALNAAIRKISVGKIASLTVLPGAAERWIAGDDFGLARPAAWSRRKTPEALVLRRG